VNAGNRKINIMDFNEAGDGGVSVASAEPHVNAITFASSRDR